MEKLIKNILNEVKKERLQESSESKNLKVDVSTIPNSGKGLFAKKDFKKGEYICKFTGDYIDSKELEKRDVGGARSAYFIYIDDDTTLDVYDSKCLAKYANDAEGFRKIRGKKNNSALAQDGKNIYIQATKDIDAGDEIFVGYGKDYWDNIH
jgi:SET domain-containing protein